MFIAAPVLLVGSVYAFNPDARRDLVRGATAAWTAPGASLAVVTGMSTADEAFGPPHTGHQDVVPPDLHPHAPLPPPIPVVPDIPMAGGVPEPAETGCPHRLGGFTLLSPSWQDFILANPLPAQQTATVVWAEPKPLTPDEEKHIKKIYSTEDFLRQHPDLADEVQRVRRGETLPQRRYHVQEAITSHFLFA